MYQSYGSSQNMNNFTPYNPNPNKFQNSMNMNNNNNIGMSQMGNFNNIGQSQNMLNLSNTGKINNQKNLMNYEIDIDIERATRDLVYIGGNKEKFDQYIKKLNTSILGDNEMEEKMKYMQQQQQKNQGGGGFGFNRYLVSFIIILVGVIMISTRLINSNRVVISDNQIVGVLRRLRARRCHHKWEG